MIRALPEHYLRFSIAAVRPAMGMLLIGMVCACSSARDVPAGAPENDAGPAATGRDAAHEDVHSPDAGPYDTGDIDAACGPHNCIGCCLDDSCKRGDSVEECGGRGRACMACQGSQDCPYGVCTPCESDADCNDTWIHRCDTATRTCVQCLASDDCAVRGPFLPVCTSDHRCVQCGRDEDCAGNPVAMGPICDTSKAAPVCVCETDADCGGSIYGRTCAGNPRYCSCETSAECTAVRPACQREVGVDVRQCSPACVSDADCTNLYPATRCDATSGQCVACVADVECPPWVPPAAIHTQESACSASTAPIAGP